MALQEQAPELPDHFPKPWREAFAKMLDFMERKQPFPADNTIIAEEKPYGTSLRVSGEGIRKQIAEIKPLTMIIANRNDAPGIRVTYGTVGTWSADDEMDAMEDGTDEHPFFYLSEGLASDDYVFVKLTVSYDGAFWRIDEIEIARDSVEPVPSDTEAFFILGRVKIENDRVVSISQTNYGNAAWVRGGDADSQQDLFLPYS